MKENKEFNVQTNEKIDDFNKKDFLLDIPKGFLLGLAFIIPGFSGGSIAAILGIYERMITAVADIFKSFKKSLITLLPLGIGAVLGVIALLFPLGWALNAFPIPTVSLFVGLALGGLPSVTDKIKGKVRPTNVLAFALPFIIAAALCFAPTGADVNLFNLTFGGYILLFFIGFISSSAMIVPGISGSMLLLVLGYYNPIIELVTNHLLRGKDILDCILATGAFGIGLALGIILISILMKFLFKKYPRGTFFAIVGFIVGSIPAVYVSTAKDVGLTFDNLPSSAWYWIISAALLLAGFTAAFIFVKKMKKYEK